MKSVSLLLFAVVSTGLLLAGCASPPKAAGISVTVTGFRADETDSVPTHAIMTLTFTSENVEAIGLTHTTHKLYFTNRYVGQAENPNPVGVPPLGTVNQDVTFNLEDPGVVRQILSVADQAPYRLETTLYYSEGDTKHQLKVTSEGKVPLLGLEHAAR
jgi:hypothetical protein